MTVGVVCDSTAYLSPEEIEKYRLHMASLWVHDGTENQRELDMDFKAAYDRLADTRELPTSSQPSPEEMRRAMLAALEYGDGEAVGVFISSKMSGTVDSARMVADMIIAENPGAKIDIVDSESNCRQEGFATLSAAQAALDGKTRAECVQAAQDTIRRTRFLFTPHTLEYLRRGGRIGNASALLGSLLQITPVLTVEGGVTTTAAKVRTRAKALTEMVSRFTADTQRCGLRRTVVMAIADIEAATEFARDRIEPLVGHAVDVVPIGPVIGLHVGPAVGLIYETEEPLR